jgi:UDP-N-acetylglucosamine--N-acetylmuramyl-(pentapeptide) pyrophosphoryl-undecaprenol N-acetylglucosamine transferase
VSLSEAKALLQKRKPDAVLSFGGYVAVPFALAAKMLRIPVVTHEQTMTSGFANTLIGWFARAIALSFPDSRQALFRRKTIITGNPLRAGVFETKQKRPQWLSAKLSAPLLLVMGGNQGSRVINTLVGESLSELLPHWTIVHQCGQPTADENAQEHLLRQKNRLDEALQERYYVREWIDEADLFWLYRRAFCALSRAGANSVMELAAARVPSLLVPLPASRRGEQQKNADWLMRAGGAIIIDQRILTTSTLIAALHKLKALEPTMRQNLGHISVPHNAAEQVYAVVSQTVLTR